MRLRARERRVGEVRGLTVEGFRRGPGVSSEILITFGMIAQRPVSSRGVWLVARMAITVQTVA